MPVVSFTGYVPGARFDGEPWTHVRVEESTSSSGPWAAVETIALSPIDSNPEHPQTRDFTSDDPTITVGYFRIVFVDGDGDEQFTEPVPYPSRDGAPLAAVLRDQSKVDFDALGFETDEQLQTLIDQAVSLVYRYTGARWSDLDVFSGGPEGTDADMIEPLARLAVTTITEFLAYRLQSDIPETMADFDLISSFSAGSYSETRRDPGKGTNQLALLNSLLWPLMDLVHQEEWTTIMGGPNAPAFAVTEVDWSANSSYFGTDPYYLGGLPNDPWPPVS